MDDKPAEFLFEDHIDTIRHEIDRRKHKWRLQESILWMDWNDVHMKILAHIHIKWYQFDPKKAALHNWLNRIISNQIKNMIRNVYSSFQSPCIRCPHNKGGEKCSVFNTQHNPACSLFSKWASSKRYKLEIQFAQSQDAEIPGGENNNLKKELISRECSFLDFEIKIPEFNSLLQKKLRPLEWKAYTYLFVEHMTDIQAAKSLGYDTTGNKNSRGYKAVLKIKTLIYKKAMEVVKEMEF